MFTDTVLITVWSWESSAEALINLRFCISINDCIIDGRTIQSICYIEFLLCTCMHACMAWLYILLDFTYHDTLYYAHNYMVVSPFVWGRLLLQQCFRSYENMYELHQSLGHLELVEIPKIYIFNFEFTVSWIPFKSTKTELAFPTTESQTSDCTENTQCSPSDIPLHLIASCHGGCIRARATVWRYEVMQTLTIQDCWTPSKGKT